MTQIKRLPKYEQMSIAHEHARSWFSCLKDCVDTDKYFPEPLRKIILNGYVTEVVPSRLHNRLHEDFALGKTTRENIYKEALEHAHWMVRDALAEGTLTEEQIREVMSRVKS